MTLDLYAHDATPLPSWVQEIRPGQVDAVEEIHDAYQSGADVVMLDAPTGSGKTLIAELVRRTIPQPPAAKTMYVCNTIGLQEQFLRDFPYARLIKGRANYIPVDAPSLDYTCADCLGRECDWCEDIDGVKLCPYDIAAVSADLSTLAVTNTSYFIHATNYARKFRDRHLIIADESDTLEDILTGFIEFRVSDRWLKRLRVNPPKKGSHMTTVREWVRDVLMKAIKDAMANGLGGDQVERARAKRELSGLYSTALKFMGDTGEWIRDNDAGPCVFKPITVGPWGEEALWQHGTKWLCMSGSIVSAREQVESLGAKGLDVRSVGVPMTFPVENRPIIFAPIADMKFSNREEAWPTMAEGITRLLEKEHPNERVLIHCVSYALAKYLHEEVDTPFRDSITYTNSSERDTAFERFKLAPAAVLFAASMDRGFDFKDELARVVLIPKVPFPNISDRRISERTHQPGGQEWYDVQTVRTVLQMTGRGVRSEDDYCVTYILDAQFTGNLWPKAKMYFPKWWRDAVNKRYDWRWLKDINAPNNTKEVVR